MIRILSCLTIIPKFPIKWICYSLKIIYKLSKELNYQPRPQIFFLALLMMIALRKKTLKNVGTFSLMLSYSKRIAILTILYYGHSMSYKKSNYLATIQFYFVIQIVQTAKASLFFYNTKKKLLQYFAVFLKGFL